MEGEEAGRQEEGSGRRLASCREGMTRWKRTKSGSISSRLKRRPRRPSLGGPHCWAPAAAELNVSPRRPVGIDEWGGHDIDHPGQTSHLGGRPPTSGRPPNPGRDVHPSVEITHPGLRPSNPARQFIARGASPMYILTCGGVGGCSQLEAAGTFLGCWRGMHHLAVGAGEESIHLRVPA